MYWVLHVVVTLQDAQIPHALNSVFLLPCPFFRDFMFACRQLPFLRSLLVIHFLLGYLPRVHLCLQCPLGLLQTLGSTMYVIG